MRNLLRETGIWARCPYVGPLLTQTRRMRRMVRLTAYAPRRFPMRQWKQVLFTDESQFILFRRAGLSSIYRRRGEPFTDACVIERDWFGYGSVMVCGGISHGVKSQLIVIASNLTAVRYRDEVLRRTAVPLLCSNNVSWFYSKITPGPMKSEFILTFLLTITLSYSAGRHTFQFSV